MLVKCWAGGVLVLQDVAEARTYSDFTSSIEANLRGSDIGMSYLVFMQIVDSFKNLSCHVLQDRLRQGSNRGEEVL